MSQDFQKVLVKDDRLNVKDTIKYAVVKGGQNVTSAEFRANSDSKSSHTYNIQVPSEQTVIDREVMWTSTVKLKLTGTGTVDDTPTPGAATIALFDYGKADALAPFPLHSLVNVMQCTINNNTISQNTADILPVLTRMLKRKQIAKYNGYTPTALDTYSDYDNATGANNNSLGAYSNSLDNDYHPRGSWVLDSISASINASKGTFEKPVVATSGSVTKSYYVTFTVTEPLLLSPFIFGHPWSNNQGFYGIQNMNFVMNIGQANRVWRRANGPSGFSGNQTSTWIDNSLITNFTVELESFKNSSLKFNFLTPHPSDLMPSRNVVGFYELPRFITPQAKTIVAAVTDGAVASEKGLTSTTIQLNQIPDKLLICVKKSVASLKNTDADFFYTITNMRLDFNNQAGLMTSVSQQELYNMSVENGSNQSWLEFSGRANLYTGTGQVENVGTTGSMIVLDMAKDVQLTEDYYAPGSLGNFTLRVSVDIENQTANATSSADPLELSIITMQSGMFVCERGTSSIYTGILTKQDVLDTSRQDAYSKSEVARMVGGGLLDNLKSVGSKSMEHLPGVAKAVGEHLVCGKGEVGAGLAGAGKKSKANSRCY